MLTVRTVDHADRAAFAIALVAVHESEPADAALALAAMLRTTSGSQVIAAHAFNTTQLYGNAMAYSFFPSPDRG